MSNIPSDTPWSPRRRSSQGKKIPLTSVTCIVDGILHLKKDSSIVVVTWHDKGQKGKNHSITLYGRFGIAPDPKHTPILGKLANFQIRLLSAAQSANAEESERAGNIETYNGYIDDSGNYRR